MEIIDQLIQTRDRTLPFFDLSSEELSRTYLEGKWNIKKILIHLADAESVLLERIKRIISDPKQIIWAFDQDVWCAALDYEHCPINLSKAQYLANRNAVIYFTKKYYSEKGNTPFIHSESGLKQLKDIFDYIPFHNDSHLKQMEMALNRKAQENVQ